MQNNQENVTPLYATLQYDALKILDISIAEYFYLDMVHKLSYNRWCIKSLENCAYDMNMSKFGLLKMRDRLLSTGLLERNDKGGLKVTDKYTEVAVNKVDRSQNVRPTKFTASANKVQRIGQQSLPKNKRDRQLDLKEQKNSLFNANGTKSLAGYEAHLRQSARRAST